jgi:hypothetical protein
VQGAEADAAAAQVCDDSDQVLVGVGEPVEAGPEVVQAGGQLGPVGEQRMPSSVHRGARRTRRVAAGVAATLRTLRSTTRPRD